ncbi:MAG: sulfurtransferase [Ardenticatenales bacterium]|nr:sulfurtransferase [Ardenticatenales bacterium]MCB9172554.1 sulfurtransferase [Ardenticatenales bacterium]
MMYTTLITTEELAANLDDPQWVVVDCRFRLDDPDEGRRLYEAAHIKGALYADLDRDLAGPATPNEGRHPLPDLDDFRRTLGGWGIDEGVQLVCYDDWGGALAARLWWMVRYLGHRAVAVLDGGWPAWQAAALPTASGAEQRDATIFCGDPDPQRLATMHEVEALVQRGDGQRLIDARDAARYRGDFEPIDPAAGHIPGARNYPFSENIAATGHFKADEALAAQFQTLLADLPSDEAIVYCGSGVTATHNLLAMAHAGLPEARLFVPSWSGWSSDPSRPVER